MNLACGIIMPMNRITDKENLNKNKKSKLFENGILDMRKLNRVENIVNMNKH